VPGKKKKPENKGKGIISLIKLLKKKNKNIISKRLLED